VRERERERERERGRGRRRERAYKMKEGRVKDGRNDNARVEGTHRGYNCWIWIANKQSEVNTRWNTGRGRSLTGRQCVRRTTKVLDS
jgi:hypothetical protein